MKPINIKQIFTALLLLCSIAGAGVALAETEVDSHRKVIVVKDGDEEQTIDINVESGEIIVRTNEDGGKEKVNIRLGAFFGENVLKEVVQELEIKGLEVDGKIIINNDGESKGERIRVIHQGGGDSSFSNPLGDFFEALVAVVAIVLIFGMPVLIVGVVMYGRYKRRELVNHSIDKMIDSGREIPADMFQEATGKEKSTLNKGVMLIAIGVGLMAFLGSIAGEVGTVGIIPAMIGVAHLIIWKNEEKNNNDSSQSV